MAILCIFGIDGEAGMELGSFVALVSIVFILGELERWRSLGDPKGGLGDPNPPGTLLGESRALFTTGESGVFLDSPFKFPT